MDVCNYLNKRSNYLVNWNRVGNLLFTKHRYSTKELGQRSFIIATSAAFGFLARNKFETGAVSCVLSASLGFVIAHTLVISPLIYKRLEAKWACEELTKKINLELVGKDEFRSGINKVITHILHHDPSNASIVWGKRKRILTNLFFCLTHEIITPTNFNDLIKDQDELIECLDQNGSMPTRPSIYFSLRE